MFLFNPRGRGEPASSHRPWDPASPWLPPDPPASRPAEAEAAPGLPPGVGGWLGDFANRELLKVAEVVHALDRATEGESGAFYGGPSKESLPNYRLQPWLRPAVLEVEVDAAGGDRAILAAAVRDIKGLCTYPAEE